METKGREKVKGQEKETKRDLTWAGLMDNRTTGKTKEGSEIGFLDWDTMAQRLIKDGHTMATQWPIRVIGYNMDLEGNILPNKDSNFKRVTGITIKEYMALQQQENFLDNGYILNFSLGSHYNHLILLVPNKDKEITGILHNGQKTTITKDTILNKNHYWILTNHGRSQHLSYFLGFQFGLFTNTLGKKTSAGNQYKVSTNTQINLDKDFNSDYFFYTKNGNKKQIPTDNPYQLLLLILEHGLSFSEKLVNGENIKKYLK